MAGTRSDKSTEGMQTIEKMVYECIETLRILTPPRWTTVRGNRSLNFHIRYIALHESLSRMRQWARDNNISGDTDFLIEATTEPDRCSLYVMEMK